MNETQPFIKKTRQWADVSANSKAIGWRLEWQGSAANGKHGKRHVVAAHRREPFIEKKGGKIPQPKCVEGAAGDVGKGKKKISVESVCFSHADDQKNFTDQVSYGHC